ncbi:hypothetical protein QBC39DRAFT_390925 [Podospora conica]|nr:hypothetical protein QBC39DRAFT_390925 [Schizothecium conicum]
MDQQAITTLLAAPTLPDDIPSAVRKLSDQAASIPAPETADFLWDVFNAVFDAAGQAPSEKHITSLVELLVQLRKTEVKDPATGEARTYDDGKVWTDLPSFGWVARDLWNFDASQVEGEKLAKLERQTELLARLTALADVKDPKDPFNYSNYALWALRDAFECAGEGAGASSAVRLAAPWVVISGKSLWSLSEQEVQLHENTGVGGEKYGEKGWRGFGKARWTVWRDGFVAAQAEAKGEEVKAVAGRAAEVMRGLEK